MSLQGTGQLRPYAYPAATNIPNPSTTIIPIDDPSWAAPLSMQAMTFANLATMLADGTTITASGGKLTATGGGGGGAVSSVSNSDGSLTISPTTGAVVAGINFSGSYTWYSQQTFSNTMLTIGIHATGAFNTTIATGGVSTDGVSLISALPATSGAPQQYSPRLRFTGYGWKTNTTAGSQEVDFIIENQPQQGTTAPSGNLVFSSQINAGGYTPVFTLTSAGTITTGTWNGTTIAIANGGTGQTTANAALNALLPSQTSASGLFLQSNGTSASWVSANGGVTSVSNSDGTLTISPTTGAVVASLALGHANTWTSNQIIDIENIGVTSTDGLVIQNLTAAGSGSQQWSPRLRFVGSGYKTASVAASQVTDFIIENQPQQGATAPTANLVISSKIGSGSYATCATFDSAGDLTLVGNLKSQTVTITGLSASQAVFTDGSSNLVSNAITGTGNVVMSTSPTLVTPALGTPSSGTLTSCTGLPLTTGVTGTLPVGNGGTGNTTFTAYSLICAGTTSTGTFQNVVGVGTSGQVLTSNGASALPTWQAGGGGAVSSVSNSDGTLTISPTTGAVVASLALGHANTWTAAITENQTIAATSTDGIVLSNTTAATLSVAQWSPRLHFIGQGWKTNTTAASQTCDWIVELQCPVGTTNPFNNLSFSSQVAGGGYVVQMVLSGNGSVELGSVITGSWQASTIGIAYGGTGNTTFTAYSLICAGTTSTGTFQNVVGVGTSGQVLTSNGASALPTWQAGGGGAVSSVSNSDGTLTISPTTGAVVASLALGHANTWTGVQTFAPTAATGSPSNAIKLTTPAHTALTASTEYNTILVTAATQQFANGTLALNRFAVINAPTYAFVSGTQTLTAAVTLEISGCPTQGTSASFGGAAALRIPGAPFASANMGLVSLGNGPWNGSTSGYFTGSANGTVLAVNAASSYIGHLCNWQVAGSSKFSVDYVGNVAIGGIFSTAVTGSPSIIGSGLTFNGYTTQFTDGAVLQLDSSCTFGIFQGSSVGQQTAGGVTAGFSSNTSADVAYNESTWTGNIGSTAYTISDVIAALKTYGWLAS